MNRHLFVLAILATAMSAYVDAQNITSFKDRLTQNTGGSIGRISVDEHDSAMRAVDSYSMTTKAKSEIDGYRVSIYSGKSQNARNEALAAQSEFLAIFPHVPTHLVYSEPYFTLSVGNCRTKEDALVLWGRVKNIFTKAFIMQATIPISSFMSGEVDYTAVKQESISEDVELTGTVSDSDSKVGESRVW